jgi:glutathione S-transferase
MPHDRAKLLCREDFMLTLYHADTAVCAAKVRLVLAEKNIAFDGKLIELGRGDQFAPDYMKLNPNAVVPTLVHDGNVLIESTVINEYLDESFADRCGPPMHSAGLSCIYGPSAKTRFTTRSTP